VLEVLRAVARCAQETIDSVRVVLELGEGFGLAEVELARVQRVERGGRLGGGSGGVDHVSGHGQLLGDLGGRHARVEHLLDGAGALPVGQVLAPVVGDHLLDDPLDRRGVGVSIVGRDDVDRDAGQPDLARSEGSALTLADQGAALGVADRDDRDDDAVLAQARQELLVQLHLVADVVFELQGLRVDVLDGRDGLLAAVVGGD